jgi:hypothetical protein
MANYLTKQFPGDIAFPEMLTVAQLVKKKMESEGSVPYHNSPSPLLRKWILMSSYLSCLLSKKRLLKESD